MKCVMSLFVGLALLAVLLTLAGCGEAPAASKDSDGRARGDSVTDLVEHADGVTAIDIALEPDATMIRRADAANARLRAVFPKGYALDATHRPHITLLQRYVRTEDLDHVYEAAGKALANSGFGTFQLTADQYVVFPSKDHASLVIGVQATDQLRELQQELVDAVAPYTVKSGSAAAFFTTPDDPDIAQSTINIVTTFVPNATGRNFHPHVTVGVATADDLRRLVSEPFEPFVFSPVAASVYQLGNYGTARKELKTRKP